MSTYVFEKLTKVDNKGKVYTWEISVENKGDHSVIRIEYGYTKKVVTFQTVTSGKNIGKANETTHYTQAIQEAKSKWDKKNEQFNMTTFLPMLAYTYNLSKVTFPAYIQPKLDGYRMLYNTTTKDLYTRTGGIMDKLLFPDIVADLKGLPEGYILDGEFYSKDLPFEELGIIRKKKLNPVEKEKMKLIKYYVYDLIIPSDLDKTFYERQTVLFEFLFLKEMQYIQMLETFPVKSEEDIKCYHSHFVTTGFEGTIVRNASSVYRVGMRSNDLLKYKDFQDAEFPIVGYTFEESPAGLPLIVYQVKVKEGVMCSVRPKGTVEERNRIYTDCVKDFSLYKGKNLWVKFFEYTEDGNLRFPTTKTESVTSYIRNEIV